MIDEIRRLPDNYGVDDLLALNKLRPAEIEAIKTSAAAMLQTAIGVPMSLRTLHEYFVSAIVLGIRLAKKELV
jgi:hypothetical protein